MKALAAIAALVAVLGGGGYVVSQGHRHGEASSPHHFRASPSSAQADPSQTAFNREMDLAMARMHEDMRKAGSTGDPDRDFALMMIPHHQGAIDMAILQLRFGKDERLRRLAQGIIVEQGQEIAVMRAILADPAALAQTAPNTFIVQEISK